jgi:hypothetical protein
LLVLAVVVEKVPLHMPLEVQGLEECLKELSLRLLERNTPQVLALAVLETHQILATLEMATILILVVRVLFLHSPPMAEVEGAIPQQLAMFGVLEMPQMEVAVAVELATL